MVQGVEHKDSSFIKVLQPAVPYHEWIEYRDRVEYLEKEPITYFEAIKMAKEKYKFILGVFYRTTRPIYHKELSGDHNPITKNLSRKIRLKKVK